MMLSSDNHYTNHDAFRLFFIGDGVNIHVMVDLDCAGDGCPMLEMFGITLPSMLK